MQELPKVTAKIKKYMREIAKLRFIKGTKPSREYYSAIGKKGAQKRWGNRERLDKDTGTR